MPTPLGHALGALIVTAPVRARWKVTGAGIAAAAVAAGVAPDLDLLFGRHSAETHSVGAAIGAGLLVWAIAAHLAGPAARSFGARDLALVVALAWASHVLLDWLGSDTSPPIGVMALWPAASAYYESDLHVFMAVSRRYWLPEFWTYNFTVLARELLTLGLPALLAEWLVRRRRAGKAVS
jgi:hypothetical protein